MAAFMDELVIDPISGEQITPRHAIIIPEVPGIRNMLEYLKSVGSTIGPSNIRSAYRVGGSVKIYLRFLKHVDEVINAGVFIKGQYLEVNYGVPPATEVFLKNVDSEIPNLALSKHLESYGNLLSKIITKKIVVESSEFGHVESNIRRVYMKLNPETVLPKSFIVNHCMNDYVIGVSLTNEATPEKADIPIIVEETTSDSTNEKKNVSKKSPNKSSGGDSVSVLDIPFIPENRSPPGLPTAVRSRGFRGRGRMARGRRGFGRSNCTLVTKMKKTIKRGGRPRLASRSGSRIDMCRKVAAVEKSLDSIGEPEVDPSYEEDMDTVNRPLNGVDSSQMNGIDNEETSSKKTKFTLENSDLGFVVNRVYSENESVPFNDGTSSNGDDVGIQPYPFTIAKLEEFLREVKNSRNPMEVAAGMLEANNTSGAMSELCTQLLEYGSINKDYAIRLRVNRLVQLLSDGRQ